MKPPSPHPAAQVDRRHADRSRPGDIREACRLILGALAIGLIALWPGLGEPQPDPGVVATVVGVVLVVVFIGLTVWLTRKIWLGKNWARWAMLFYLLLGWVLAVADLNAEMARSPITAIISVVTGVMEMFACWLLFFGAGGQWFAANAADRGPADEGVS
jgi:hypothetical protein